MAATLLASGCGQQGGMGGAEAPRAQVVVDTVQTDDVQLYMYVTGEMKPYKDVEVRARVAGELQALYFKSGGIIKKGEQLALIEPDQYQVALDAAEAQLEVSKANLSLAQANLRRAETLVANGTIPKEEYESRLADYAKAQATVKLDGTAVEKAKLDLSYTKIVAAIPGKMTKNFVDVGNYISPNTASATLVSIAQMDPMYVDFQISDRQFTDLKTRMGYHGAFEKAMQNLDKTADAVDTETPATVEAKNDSGWGRIDVSVTTTSDVLTADFPLSGRIVTTADNRVDRESGQITLRGEVRNPLLHVDGQDDYLLYAGQITRVRIPHDLVKDAILVDEEAILTDLDTKYVLVVAKEMYTPKNPLTGLPVVDPVTKTPVPATEEFVIQRRDIVLGKLLDTQKRIVTSGLKKGETYVVKGVQRARVGSPVDPVTLADFEKQRAEAL